MAQLTLEDEPADAEDGDPDEPVIETPKCVVDGCETEVPGLFDGWEHPRRDGVVCNDCWEYADRHNHLPDEEPRGQACIECLREEGKIESE